MRQAIIFDFFGTLVQYRHGTDSLFFNDSFRVLRDFGFQGSYDQFLEAWSSLYERLLESSKASGVEFHMTHAANEFFALSGMASGSAVDAFVKVFLKEWNRGVSYYPAIAGFLKELSNDFTLAVVSNTHHPDLVSEHLASMNVGSFFSEVITSIEVGYRKPHPKIFNVAMDRLGIASSEALFIGDSYQDDYIGARRAGMKALLIDPDGRFDIPREDRLQDVFGVSSSAFAKSEVEL